MAGEWLAGSIKANLCLDRSKWSEGVKKTEKDQRSLQGFSEKTARSIKKIGTGFTIAGTAIVGSLGLMIKKYVEAGDQVHKMALRTGFATETLSELSYAAQISGANIESIEKAVKKMSKTIVDAERGLSTYVEAFKLIGLEAKDLIDLSPEEQFLKIGNAIASVESPTIRAAAAVDIFGRAGTQLLPLFASGAAGLDELRQKAHELGIVFDQEAANKAAKLADAQTALKESFKGVMFAIADGLVPIVTKLVDKITVIVTKVTDWSKANPFLFGTITKVAGAIGALMLVLGPLAIMLPSLVKGFKMMGKEAGKAGLSIKGMKVPITGLSGILKKLPAVGLAAFAGWKIGRLIGEVTGLDKAIQNLLVSQYGSVGIVGKQKTAYDELLNTHKLHGNAIMKLEMKYGSFEKALEAVKNGEVDLTGKVREADKALEAFGGTATKAAKMIAKLEMPTMNFVYELEKSEPIFKKIMTNFENLELAKEDYDYFYVESTEGMTASVMGQIDGLKDYQIQMNEDLAGSAETTTEDIGGRWSQLGDDIAGSFGSAVDSLLTKGSDLKDGFNVLWQGIQNSFKNLIVDFITGEAKKLFTGLISGAVDAGGKVSTGLGDAIGGVKKSALGLAKGFSPGGVISSAITGAVSGLITGLMTGAKMTKQIRLLRDIKWWLQGLTERVVQIGVMSRLDEIMASGREILPKLDAQSSLLDGIKNVAIGIRDAIQEVVSALTSKGTIYVDVMRASPIQNAIKDLMQKSKIQIKGLQEELKTATGERKTALEKYIAAMQRTSDLKQKQLLEMLRKQEGGIAGEKPSQREEEFFKKVMEGTGLSRERIDQEIIKLMQETGLSREKTIEGIISGQIKLIIGATAGIGTAVTSAISKGFASLLSMPALAGPAPILEPAPVSGMAIDRMPARSPERVKEIRMQNRIEIHMEGKMITTRDYTRKELIPEIVDALDVNADEALTKMAEKLKKAM